MLISVTHATRDPSGVWRSNDRNGLTAAYRAPGTIATSPGTAAMNAPPESMPPAQHP